HPRPPQPLLPRATGPLVRRPRRPRGAGRRVRERPRRLAARRPARRGAPARAVGPGPYGVRRAEGPVRRRPGAAVVGARGAGGRGPAGGRRGSSAGARRLAPPPLWRPPGGALELAESLLSAGRDRGPEVALLAHKTVAASHFRMGAYAAAAAACEAAMSLARAGGHDLAEPEILEVLGMTRCEEGRFDDSRRLLSQALVHYRARGDLFGAASALYQLGNVYLNLRQPEDARPLLVEALQTARKAEAESLVPHIDYALGVASLELGDFAGARDRLSRALFAARRDGDASRQAAALSVLFRTAAKAGDRASAKRYLEEGLTIAVEIRETPRVLKLLIYLAEAWLAAGVRLRDAERLLRLALSQSEVAHWARELAEDLLSTAALEAELAALRE